MHVSKVGLGMILALAACGGGGGGGSTATVAQQCSQYCAAIEAVCSGSNEQYTGLTGTCQSYCETQRWPEGLAGDGVGNTLACRNTHVELARMGDAAVHCKHAGPSGGGQCGSWCDNYCFLALQSCTGANAAGLGFTDSPSCLAACSGLAIGGQVNAPAGDTVQCRIYYAGAAASMPDPYCGNAQVVSSATVGGTAADGPCH